MTLFISAMAATARERARQAGMFKFWSLAREGRPGHWTGVGYSVNEAQVTEWANSQIVIGTTFRIACCAFINNHWSWE